MTVVKSRAGHPTCKTNLAILLTRGFFFFLVYVTIWENEPVSENIYYHVHVEIVVRARRR